MTPHEVAQLARKHAASLRATLRLLKQEVPPLPDKVLDWYDSTANKLEELAAKAENNDPDAIMEIHKILGRPESLTSEFAKAHDIAREVMNPVKPQISNGGNGGFER